MTDDDKLKLGCIAAKWIEAEWQRRALKTDRAMACVIARKHGIEIDYTYDGSGRNGTYRDDREEMQTVIDRIVELDREYRSTAARASALRSAMNKICKASGFVCAIKSKALSDELSELDKIKGMEEAADNE